MNKQTKKPVKMKNTQYILIILIAFFSCKAQQVNTTSNLPKIENNLGGDIDYTNEALELTLKQPNGVISTIGKITKNGIVQINLPEIAIKTIYDEINMAATPLESMFEMTNCNGKDPFAKSNYEGVFSEKYKLIYVRKYGLDVAYLAAVSSKEVLKNNQYVNDTLATGSTYSFFNIDRTIVYNNECIQNSFSGTYDIELTRNANISFNKGWNFIKETLVETQEKITGTYKRQLPKKITYTNANYKDTGIKWYLKKLVEDDKIQLAKKLFNLTPITKDEFMKWLPNKLDELVVTTKEFGNPPNGQQNKNNLHLIYNNDAQKKQIDLYIVDCAKSPDDLEMINFAYAMANDGKNAKDIKPYVAQYNEQENSTKMLYKIQDRIFVDATGTNINPEELWNYIKKLNVEKLIQ